ncbi:hypothetical protein DPMN_008251 [Dreissena polymorpha]|uniref:Uncharacterized protein n=1 Tax=Dreissena polymorpha TaxID=45954 RepID=A0A9D4MXQ5_DREPO|nr:hypothetical protein DPMN_008251 [Dreissena polymorpha]
MAVLLSLSGDRSEDDTSKCRRSVERVRVQSARPSSRPIPVPAPSVPRGCPIPTVPDEVTMDAWD